MRILAALLLLLAAPAGAATIVLDFEEEALGDHGSSFVSAEAPVTFTGWRGAELNVRIFDGSQALRAGDEGGSLLLTFSVPVLSLSIDFGNDSDDPAVTHEPALLIGFDALGEIVGFATLAPNRNRLVDQTLRVSGGVLIASAFFAFVQHGDFEDVSPIIDRLTLVTVPEPGTLGLLALAALVGGVAVGPIRTQRRPVL